ncbi:hypothetical protein ACH5RR_002850 [Cinchona calisaya]|uniref:Glycosyltransferase n=1 Tax=Cinchona calisaya TaxID=153742 RepID=A0ABD3AT57_9GENT
MTKPNLYSDHAYNQKNYQNGLKRSQVVVVMVPFPAQGHLNQLLHLSRLISSDNIPVHFAGTTTHNSQAKLRVHGFVPSTLSNVFFHDFEIPPFQSPPPNPNASIKFPSHLQPSFDATSHLREPIAKLLHSLSYTCNRVVVIHDTLMASVVQDFTSIQNAESYTFRSISAFASFWYSWEAMGRPFPVNDELEKDLPLLKSCFTSSFKNFISSQLEYAKFSSGNLYNSSRAIEGEFLDLLQKEPVKGNKKLWAIGPLNPIEKSDQNNKSSGRRHECLHWLDKQSPRSVIFVSFGTTTSLTDQQIIEIATGLEKSAIKFIWALRDADKGDIFSGEVRNIELPKGYENRVKERERGLVVRDWAPQLDILRHPSTGGFMSHCGWNSCMESISHGVPIAAWPMHSDQPRNCMLITKLLKIGIVVNDWECRDQLVRPSDIVNAVRRLIDSKEGAEIRRRAVELCLSVGRKSVAEGGISRMELDSFVAHISR